MFRIGVGTSATRGSTELANIWDGGRSCWAAGRRTGVPPTLGSPNLTQPSTNQLGCGTQRLQTKPVHRFLFRRLGLVCLSVLLLYICALSQLTTRHCAQPVSWPVVFSVYRRTRVVLKSNSHPVSWSILPILDGSREHTRQKR